MSIEEVPRELRPAAEAALNEFRAAWADGEAAPAWLAQYEVLVVRATRAGGESLEVYLPRPLLEDLANLDAEGLSQALGDLRAIPARAGESGGRWWLIGEQGRARALPHRPFV